MSFRALAAALLVSAVSLSGFSAPLPQYGQKTIICFPKNDLNREDSLEAADANLTEKDFGDIIDSVVAKFAPVVASHGGKLTVNKLWTDATVNASAEQSGADWVLNMYGGLARRPEVTKDGFAMVVCHELGHHLGGYAFYGPTDWAASEGEADYFATQACARTIWGTTQSPQENDEISPAAKEKCDLAWPLDASRALCYRSAAASQSVTTLLAKLSGDAAVPDAAKPDPTVVSALSVEHPEAQCRLDTYLAGAVCGVSFDLSVIPGKGFADHNSKAAELEALKFTCGSGAGARPLCWYHSAK